LEAVLGGYLSSVHVSAEPWITLATVELSTNTATRQARETVRNALSPLIAQWMLNDVLTATGEVVKNALQHAADGPFVLTVRRRPDTNVVRIGVSDGDPRFPELSAADPWAGRGQGLNIVASIATTLSVSPTPEGKEVWFEITPDR
jgi:anti-sigma regulatory factor (Ser/Thr protein kinase)